MPSLKKPPLGAGGQLRLKMGYGGMLAQSEKVAKAFGPDRGYRLMIVVVVVKATATIISTSFLVFLTWKFSPHFIG